MQHKGGNTVKYDFFANKTKNILEPVRTRKTKSCHSQLKKQVKCREERIRNIKIQAKGKDFSSCVYVYLLIIFAIDSKC